LAPKKAEVDCYFITVDGGSHGDFHSPEVQKREWQFFDKYLRGAKATISAETISNLAR
jgi:hypothetical protein